MLNLIEKARCAKVLAGVAAGMCLGSMAEARSITVSFGENVILDGSGGDVQQLMAGTGSTTTIVGTQQVEKALVSGQAATVNLGPNGRIDELAIGFGGIFNQAGGSVGKLSTIATLHTINIADGRVEELALFNGRPTVNIGGGQIDTILVRTRESTINIFADALTDIRINGISVPVLIPPLALGDPELIIDADVLALFTNLILNSLLDPKPLELLLDTLTLDVEFPGDVTESIVFDFDGFNFLAPNQISPFDQITLSNSAGFPGPRVIDGGIAVVPAPAAAGAGLIGLVSLAGRRRRSAV